MKRITFLTTLFLIVAALITGCERHIESVFEGSGQKLDVLCGFENVKLWDISPETGFNLSLSKEHVTEGVFSLKVVYPIAMYPSINTRKLHNRWGAYDYLYFDVFNPQNETINFVVRLDDVKKRRINIECPLKPGINNVRIPKEKIAREIDADNVAFVVLFLVKPQKRMTLYFDNMCLLHSSQDREGSKLQVKNFQDSKQLSMKQIVQNSTIHEVFEPVVMHAKLPSAGKLEVIVANLSEPKKKNILVSNGIPFAPGQLFSEDNFAVLDRNGKEIPIAIKVLAKWPFDNSVRSLLVQFPFEIEYNYEHLFIQWGHPRKTSVRDNVAVTWVIPEGIILLPAEWLCSSRVVGEQIPVGRHPFPEYDQKIEKAYPKIRDMPLTGDIRNDGYYDITHVFYQLYARTGEEDYFKAARKEAVHYRDEIIKEGPQRGRHEKYKETRYIYMQAMIDDYLLTGDEESFKVAQYMVEYLKNNFDVAFAFFPRNAKHFWTEREIAFPFLNIISYYELTGAKECLLFAQQIMQNLYKTQNEWPGRGGFIHNLYSHDPEEGAHPDEYGGSPFMTGLLLEAVIKYHELTNSNIAKESIFKALDWLIREGLSSDRKSVVYMTSDKGRNSRTPDLNLLLVHAFGYGYKISQNEREEYLDIGKALFEEGIKNAWLGDRKHFAQNYRSSGHFLAYIMKKND